MNSSDLLRFACPACGARLGVKAEQRGRRLKCPKCQRSLRIPTVAAGRGQGTDGESSHAGQAPKAVSPAAEQPRASSAPAPDHNLFTDEVPVVCRVCFTRMYAPISKIGSSVQCPDCFAYTEVKAVDRPPKKSSSSTYSAPEPASSSPSDDESDYRLQEPHLPWHGTSDRLVAVVCELCHTRMHAREDQVDEYIACPDCGRLNRVPSPEQARLQRLPNIDHPELDLNIAPPDQDVNVPLKQHADELLAQAEEDLIRREREMPKMPERPMTQGIFSFPFRPQMVALWTTCSLLIFMVMVLVQIVFSMSDVRMLIPGILLISLGTPCVIGFIATHLIAIVFNTAEGFDAIVHWPEHAAFEWLLDVWLLFAAFAYSNLTGFILYNLQFPLGLVLPINVTVCFFLFPVMLLSMLEAGSRLVPFSVEVWWSMLASTVSWIAFYVQAVLVAAAVGGMAFLAVTQTSPLLRIVTQIALSVIAAGSLLVYFRLIGRLVLACGSLSRDEPLAEQAPAAAPDDIASFSTEEEMVLRDEG